MELIEPDSGAPRILRQEAASGVKWLATSQMYRQVTQIVTTAVLARLIAVGDFGLLGMAMVVTGFVALFKDLGTSAAVVQQEKISEEFLSSVYWVNIAIGIVSMVILCAASTLVSYLYQEPRVGTLVMVLSITFPISALTNTHQALLMRVLAYRKLAIVEMVAVTCGSLLGISIALLGGGVWSLVYRTVAVTVATTLLLWLFAGWRPKWVFRLEKVRSIGGYSLNLTGFNVINYWIRNADYMLIGRFLGDESLGFYSLAYTFLLFPVRNISSVIGRVMFPLYSKIQSDDSRFRRVHTQVVGAIALVSFPLMVGLVLLREPFVLLFLGEKWLPVVPVILFLASVGMIQSIATTSGTIYQAKGRTDLLLYWGVAAGVMILGAFVIGLQWGIVGVAAAYAGATVLLFCPGQWMVLRLIGLPVYELVGSLWRPMCTTAMMASGIWAMRWVIPPDWPLACSFTILVVGGVVIYLTSTWLINRERLVQSWSLLAGKGAE